MNWSTEQQDIFDFFRSGSGNLVIEAFAGTGKTTTITEAFSHAPEARILYAVFNKRNQKEAEAKITDHRVEVKTLHALGYSFIKRVWPSAKPDDIVEFDRIAETLKDYAQLKQDKEFVGNVAQLVSFLKNSSISPSENDAREIAQFRGISFEDERQDSILISSALRVLELSRINDKQGRISFNDMVWLPVAMGIVRPWFNLVCIDEAQDMNMPQLMMARQACIPGGRVVVVGDSRQAIYGFRGAVQNGMQMMKVTLKAKTLMLSTTYRCPKEVVKIASVIVPAYKAADTAPQGLVESVNGTDKATVGSAILSRLNAPLMPLALSFLRRNIPARIEGRDIGKQLIGMLRKLKSKDIQDLIGKLKEWELRQIEKLQDSKNAEKKIEVIRDTCETLSCIAEASESVSDCERRLSSLFEDTNEKSRPAVILSSVHKAKGLEWDRVFILSETFNRKVKNGDASEEKNIYYVAVTRAKKELYLVGGTAPQASEDKKQGETTPSQSNEPINETKTVSWPLKSNTKVTPRKFTGAADTRPGAELGQPMARKESHPGEQTVCADVPSGFNLDNFDIPPGQVRRQVGDVFLYGKLEYIVVRVSASSSTARCLSRRQKTITNKLTGEERTFDDSPNEIRISSCCDKQDVIRREKDFQPGKSGLGRNNQTTNNGQESEERNIMASKKKAPAKKESKAGNFMTLIVGLAKAGKTEKEITSAVKANYGQPSNAQTYLIGREWRRANGQLGSGRGRKSEEKPKVAKKAAGKALAGKPAKKASAPAPKAKKKASGGVVASPVPPPRSSNAEVGENAPTESVSTELTEA